MSADRIYPYTTLEMELLGLCGNAYESLGCILDLWDEDIPVPSVEELIRALRELERRGWIQFERLYSERPDYDDTEAVDPIELTNQARLWWRSTEAGLRALQAEERELEVALGIDPREIRSMECGVAAHILELVAERQMTVESAVAKWPLGSERKWPRVAREAIALLSRLSVSGVTDIAAARLKQLAAELKP